MNNEEIRERVLYVTRDGKSFDSRKEAKAYVEKVKVIQDLRNVFPGGAGDMAWDLMKDMAERPNEYIEVLKSHVKGGS